jgi:hypothetical protein
MRKQCIVAGAVLAGAAGFATRTWLWPAPPGHDPQPSAATVEPSRPGDRSWIVGAWRSDELDYGSFGEWKGAERIELDARSPDDIDLWLVRADGRRERAGDSQPSLMDDDRLFFGPVGSGLLFRYRRTGDTLALDLNDGETRIRATLRRVPAAP